MDFNVQKKCLETRLSALSAGMLAGQGLSALARASEAQIAGRGSRASTLAGREMRAILTALDRLKAGEYGSCRICGADIAPEQLRAHPEIPFCESCSA